MSFLSDSSDWACTFAADRTDRHAKDRVASERLGIGVSSLASGLYRLIRDYLPGGASRLAALLLPQILPVFSVVAPCPGAPGAAPALGWSSGRRALESSPCSTDTGHQAHHSVVTARTTGAAASSTFPSPTGAASQ